VTVVAALPSVDTLVTGLVDYAGLFPPAGLDMPAAVRQYSAYRSEGHARVLGRFVVPVARLTEFFTAAAGFLPGQRSEAPWRIAALGGGDVVGDLQSIAAANARHADAERDRAVVDVFEVKASTVAEIESLRRVVPEALELYVEVPLGSVGASLLPALRGWAHAKIRTGGVTPEAIPPARDIASFLLAAAHAGVSFKATAGLHHAIRARRALTYAVSSPEAVMHGFINVFVAAALAQAGALEDEVRAALEETDPAAFRFGAADVSWRDRRITLAQLRDMRLHFARSFGSCSFNEPVQDLQSWGLM
jgi:hypothetical protein